jgi:hypothetical protein
MSFTLDFTASVTTDGETKEVTTSATLEGDYAASGVITATTTYQTISTSGDYVACVVYNAGSVDVSVRVGTGSVTTGYYFMTCPPGAFVIVPGLLKNDDGIIIECGDPAVKAQTGTAEVEFAIILS